MYYCRMAESVSINPQAFWTIAELDRLWELRNERVSFHAISVTMQREEISLTREYNSDKCRHAFRKYTVLPHSLYKDQMPWTTAETDLLREILVFGHKSYPEVAWDMNVAVVEHRLESDRKFTAQNCQWKARQLKGHIPKDPDNNAIPSVKNNIAEDSPSLRKSPPSVNSRSSPSQAPWDEQEVGQSSSQVSPLEPNHLIPNDGVMEDLLHENPDLPIQYEDNFQDFFAEDNPLQHGETLQPGRDDPDLYGDYFSSQHNRFYPDLGSPREQETIDYRYIQQSNDINNRFQPSDLPRNQEQDQFYSNIAIANQANQFENLGLTDSEPISLFTSFDPSNPHPALPTGHPEAPLYGLSQETITHEFSAEYEKPPTDLLPYRPASPKVYPP